VLFSAFTATFFICRDRTTSHFRRSEYSVMLSTIYFYDVKLLRR